MHFCPMITASWTLWIFLVAHFVKTCCSPIVLSVSFMVCEWTENTAYMGHFYEMICKLGLLYFHFFFFSFFVVLCLFVGLGVCESFKDLYDNSFHWFLLRRCIGWTLKHPLLIFFIFWALFDPLSGWTFVDCFLIRGRFYYLQYIAK